MGAVAVLGALLVLLPAPAAHAHPLGNFTVNHYDGLLLRPGGVELTAVVDRAEIPTAQALQELAPDGAPGPGRLRAAAAGECRALAAAVRLAVDDSAVTWRVDGGTAELVPGAAGLPTLRLTCELRADTDLAAAATVAFRDDYLADRVGWHEVTADGAGVRLIDSPVPAESITDELRRYPDDLLSSPLDVRSVEIATEPGENTGRGAPVAVASGDPFSTAMAALDRRLQGFVGERGLTPLVGVAALLLAVLLGCGHALLPGHGKTVMAAYLAGRRGRPRDALTVGATVTATHTVGVLVLGAAISVSSALAGEQVLRWLGVVSGALVAAIGAGMLRGALRPRRPVAAEAVLVPALSGAGAPSDVGHLHPHDHGHDHGHDHDHGPARGGLVGMGVAGGLVPSPSALVVLLASIGLGRTVFGVLLVLAYGLGMAATLTAVGLALVRFRDRLARRATDSGTLQRLARAAPVATAALVLLVGIALVVRGLALP